MTSPSPPIGAELRPPLHRWQYVISALSAAVSIVALIVAVYAATKSTATDLSIDSHQIDAGLQGECFTDETEPHATNFFFGQVSIRNHGDSNRTIVNVSWSGLGLPPASGPSGVLLVSNDEQRLDGLTQDMPAEARNNPMYLLDEPDIPAHAERTLYFRLVGVRLPLDQAVEFASVRVEFTFDDGRTLTLPTNINVSGAGC